MLSNLSTNQKGAVAEWAITKAAAEAGLVVYRPLFEGSRYDLIFGIGPRLLRVQCKWATFDEGVVIVRSYSCRRTKSGMLVRPYGQNEIDGLAVYCRQLDRCFYLPVPLVDGRRQIHLRTAEARNKQRSGVNWADDFDFQRLHWGSIAGL